MIPSIANQSSTCTITMKIERMTKFTRPRDSSQDWQLFPLCKWLKTSNTHSIPRLQWPRRLFILHFLILEPVLSREGLRSATDFVLEKFKNSWWDSPKQLLHSTTRIQPMQRESARWKTPRTRQGFSLHAQAVDSGIPQDTWSTATASLAIDSLARNVKVLFLCL